MPQTINYADFSGGLNYLETSTVLGSDMSKVWWREGSYNCRVYNNKGAIRMNGNTLVGSAFSTYIQGISNCKVNSNEYLLVVTAGNLYQFDGLNFNLIQGGMDNKAKVTFAQYGQGMIISDGITEPFIYFPEKVNQTLGNISVTATSTTAIGSGFLNALSVGDQIIINNQTNIVSAINSNTNITLRTASNATYTGTNATTTKIAYLNCNNIPIGSGTVTLRSTVIWTWLHRIFIGTSQGYFWSALGSYGDWTSVGNAGYSYDIGKPILAIRDFRGYLALYHGVLNGTSLIEGSTDPSAWTVRLNYADRSTSSQWGVITNQMNQFFADQAIFTLSPNALGTIILGDELSKNINNRTLGLLNGKYDATRANQAIIVNNITKRELWFYLPVLGEPEFNSVHIYDYMNNCWMKRIIPQNITCATTFNNSIYVGTDSGQILAEDTGETFNGIPMTWNLSTQFFNLGTNREKEIDEFNLVVDDTINYNANFGISTNYDPNNIYDVYQLNDQSTNSNTLVWDTSTDSTPNNYNLWSGNGALVLDDTLSLLDTNTGYLDVNPNGLTMQDYGHWANQTNQMYTEQLFGNSQSFSLVFSGSNSQNIAILGMEFRSVFVDA